jgi:hypothetical protein
VHEEDLEVIIVEQRPGRKLSECIAIAKAYKENLGYAPVPDPDFAADVQAVINAHREPLNPPAWVEPDVSNNSSPPGVELRDGRIHACASCRIDRIAPGCGSQSD